jgi:beta-catenin-like protein 1
LQSLKKLLLNFEKKITKNMKQRMKYSDQPEKFMESELDLHNEIQELYAIAATPELYPILVQAGTVNSILGFLYFLFLFIIILIIITIIYYDLFLLFI